MTRSCKQCKKGLIVPVTGAGRYQQYMGLKVLISCRILIPTCDYCKTEWIDEKTSELLDEDAKINILNELSNEGQKVQDY
jgi:hypothetical protein